MNWTTELRYQKYENWSTDYQQALQQQVKQSQWRLHYHIQPNQGLLNDPNGFSYFNHQWHLFFTNPIQWARFTASNHGTISFPMI